VLIEVFQGGRPRSGGENILVEVAKPVAVRQGIPDYGEHRYQHLSVDGEDLQALLKNADIAMPLCVSAGNTYQFYAEEMNRHSVERLELETALRHALERNELALHYQPKVEAQTGRVTGIECLLRWRHPTFGSVPTDQLVLLAEETGLIVPIGKWALHTACLRARSWAKQGLPEIRMAVNLSVRQFMSAALLDDVIGTLADTGMDPRCIEFEVTESVMMSDPEQAVKLLRDLEAIGVRLTIDDFNRYSSLAYLKRLVACKDRRVCPGIRGRERHRY
jgi:predicted signal transduction protein with EAL and GGDEF domain